VQHVESGHRLVAQPVALAHAAEQRPFLVAPNSGCGDPDIQELFETWMAGYLVTFCRLFRAT
jgi:hypothetical protein